MRTDHDNALRQAIETTVNGNHARVGDNEDVACLMCPGFLSNQSHCAKTKLHLSRPDVVRNSVRSHR